MFCRQCIVQYCCCSLSCITLNQQISYILFLKDTPNTSLSLCKSSFTLLTPRQHSTPVIGISTPLCLSFSP